MRATVTQENFAKALNYVSKAISSNPSIPVLSNVLMEITKDTLILSTTDLEIGISTQIGADTKAPGKITVDAKTLSEFVNSLSSSGKLNVELEGKLLSVHNKMNSAEFNVVDAEEFPPLPETTGKADFKVKACAFAKSLQKVTFSSASDDSRPVLTGVLFEATKKRISMVGVDGFRLSKKVIDIERKKTDEFKHIVPARALNEVARIALDTCEEDDDLEVFILGDKNQMLFKVKDVEISTRLIEGEFPEYEQIMPKEAKYKFSADKESLAKTVKVVSIFARAAVGNKAIFEFMPEKNALKLSAQVADVGENESIVEVHDVEGDSLKTGYNVGFLSEMINAIEGEEVLFETNGVTAPGVFKDSEDKDFLHIIMPMRLD
ncbi:DNA polymerase III subunit beta [Candidatus Dojkabacteria bacterium]|nr:DNA polymerase III subunit beta [Candidatus Dojkabacteria bacterium]